MERDVIHDKWVFWRRAASVKVICHIFHLKYIPLTPIPPWSWIRVILLSLETLSLVSQSHSHSLFEVHWQPWPSSSFDVSFFSMLQISDVLRLGLSISWPVGPPILLRFFEDVVRRMLSFYPLFSPSYHLSFNLQVLAFLHVFLINLNHTYPWNCGDIYIKHTYLVHLCSMSFHCSIYSCISHF